MVHRKKERKKERKRIIIIIIIIIRYDYNLTIMKSPKPATDNRFKNLSTADLRNYWTEFHETWWSYRYMFLVGPKVFSFVVKGVSHILRGSKGVGLL
jgi:hypothetical protein